MNGPDRQSTRPINTLAVASASICTYLSNLNHNLHWKVCRISSFRPMANSAAAAAVSALNRHQHLACCRSPLLEWLPITKHGWKIERAKRCAIATSTTKTTMEILFSPYYCYCCCYQLRVHVLASLLKFSLLFFACYVRIIISTVVRLQISALIANREPSWRWAIEMIDLMKLILIA